MLTFCLVLTLSHFAGFGEGAGQSNGGKAGAAKRPQLPVLVLPAATSRPAPSRLTKGSDWHGFQPEIAALKASGKVWVNTESGVYHKSGRWYGKTKKGKFMTEAEAEAAGYKAAHN